ncbi:3-hydroxybutyrate dehydrogenase [Paramagnetospirillum marisnigri]|uniref:3-hydroxybutyrate dehydrogenase n=1 Tax=Paramagnetospirillum marisnigri TaxID=1285242 RepID=A0A178M9A2_9PROT|nr:3-hydroxybutyrate dehydrogenase [Paramagnetospirillum marisnigri]OAN44797.1 3-hydroxybutyrate dehydrogenase [Paramagnetospirillum marisnigri]
MLKGKTALVTGSTSGIGLGVARALAAQGASLMLNGFGEASAIEALRAGLERDFGVTVHYNGADLSKPDGAGGLVRDAEARLGRLDILVNNAGIQHVAPVEEFPLERWDAVIALNLTAVFQGIRAALPGMKTRGWGRIVNIASVHGLVASVNKAAYVAAKHGVLGLTKVVALETAEIDVTCNAICPGWVLTPLVQAQIDARAVREGVSIEQAGRDLLSEKQPSKSFTTPEQLGALAVFLCSPAAANMTGASLTADGGWTAQ